MDKNRIKIIALITSIFFIVLAEINQRNNGILFSEKDQPFSLREGRR